MICQFCGNEFTSTNTTRRYCSRKCKSRANHQREREKDSPNFKPKPLKSKEERFIKCNSLFPNLLDVYEQERVELLNKERAIKKKRMLNPDSVINVPCFCCKLQEVDCDPETCQKLDKYLEIY